MTYYLSTCETTLFKFMYKQFTYKWNDIYLNVTLLLHHLRVVFSSLNNKGTKDYLDNIF